MIPSQTVVTCPDCGRQLYKVNRDILAGDAVTALDLDPLAPPQPIPDPAVCPFCDGRWLHLPNKVHTARGWVKAAED